MTGSAIIRHSYKIERSKKVYSVYQLIEKKVISNNGLNENIPVLPEFVRIEQFRHFSKGMGFEHYFRIKTTNNWQTSEMVTGLYKTKNKLVFYGDHRRNGRNLIIFQFSENKEQLTIDYYTGFCPYYRAEQMTDNLKLILARYEK